MVATMSALVLGLLVSSAKDTYDSVSNNIAQSGAKILQLDHVLAAYGPETAPLRAALRQALAERIDRIWNHHRNELSGLGAVMSSTAVAEFQKSLNTLNPKTDAQKSALADATRIGGEVSQGRLLMFEQLQESMPPTLLTMLIVWLTLLFISFGLFAPRNVTVITVMLVCALTVSSAIFLILEMGRPLDGFVRVSSEPLRKALELLEHPAGS